MGTENLVIGVGSENTVKVGEYGENEAVAISVGETDGGVDIAVSTETKEIFTDQHLGPVDSVTVKEGVTIKVNIAESSLANIALAFGYPVSAVTDGTFVMGDKTDLRDPKTVYINVKGPGPGTRKITVHKAKIKGDSSKKYSKGDLTMIPCEITALCDTAKSAGERMLTIVDIGLDGTPPTVALSTPVDGGTVVKNTKGIVVWTITEANVVDQNTINYGDTFSIINITDAPNAVLVAGTIVYSPTAKTVTFTPANDWAAADSLQAIITTGLKDAAGNKLAAIKIEQFSVTV